MPVFDLEKERDDGVTCSECECKWEGGKWTSWVEHTCKGLCKIALCPGELGRGGITICLHMHKSHSRGQVGQVGSLI